MDRPLRIGLIGHGVMGRAHSNAYRQAEKFFDPACRPVLKAVCGVKEKEPEARAFAEKWGWESVELDWRRMVERPDIDVVDIVTPNHTHRDIAVAAAEHGKIVCCEKPLSVDRRQAREMAEAVTRAGVPSMTWFNYRRVPAIAMAHDLVSEGLLGRVFHYRAAYLQDWASHAELPIGGDIFWRFDARAAGSGAVGDLLSHVLDCALWLNGEIDSVCATAATFVAERYSREEGRPVGVSVDDACFGVARFRNGSLGSFDGSRFATGRKNSKTFEICGDAGSLFFDLENQNELFHYDAREKRSRQGWKRILTTDRDHPYMSRWWVAGALLGYEHTFIHTAADFLEGIASNTKRCPDFADGLAAQEVCDALLESARHKRWTEVGTPVLPDA